MPRSSSSTSSSDRRPRLRALALLVGWTLAALVAIDVAIQLAFPMPDNPRVPPGRLAQYFNYGRSLPSKLSYGMADSDARAAGTIRTGWIEQGCRKAPPALAPGHTGVTLYGMSFSNRVGRALAKIDPTMPVSLYYGWGGAPGHSFACYTILRATGADPNPVQVIGILATSLPRLLTLGALTTSFEGPTPYTYPRYRLAADGRLTAEQPVVRALADLRDPAKFAAYEAQLARHDAFYDRRQFAAPWADHSALFRLLRRAAVQGDYRQRTTDLVWTRQDEVGPLLGALLVDFARQARADGKRPIVILFQDRDFGPASLAALAGPALARAGVPTLRTDEIAPPSQPAAFLADGHFTPEIDRRIAERLRAMILSGS